MNAAVRIMKKIIVLLLSCLPLCVQAEPLRLCQESASEAPFLPQLTVNGQAFYGTHAAVVAHALNQLNIEFSIARLPLRRCMFLLESGVFDGTISLGWTTERSRKFIYPLSDSQTANEKLKISYVNYPIYALADSAVTWDGVSFSNISRGIAAPKGFLVEAQLRAMGVLQETELGVDFGLSLLQKHRVDAVVLPEGPGDNMVLNTSSEQIKKLDILFYQQPVYLAFSRQQHKLNTGQMQAIWQQIPLSRHEITGPFNQ